MPNEILPKVNAISGLGFTGLVVVLAIPKLKKLVFGNGTEIQELKDNHLHTINETLERIEKKLETINDNIIWLKAKQNGDNS